MEASSSELEIMGTARMFLQAYVLRPGWKMMEVAVIARADGGLGEPPVNEVLGCDS